MIVRNLCCSLLLLVAVFPLLGAETGLDRYIAKPDSAYRYELYHEDSDFIYRTYFIHLISQQWRSADEVDRPEWDHELQVVVPSSLHSASARTGILIVNGGTNALPLNGETESLLSTLALLSGSVVAMVSQIPNQPLNFGDETDNPRSEDAILAYSLNKYLETGDEEWPVHLAMTKSVVRTMDTMQEFLGRRDTPIDDFIVLGASKRGWTTWLTAAVDDRVKAIVPISIDLPNIDEQFTHHWDVYGFYAPAVADYVAFDLPCEMTSEQGQELLTIIDPHEYRDRFDMPKLIINSAGDQFFVTDSSQFYFSDLPAPKSLRYTFNTDHRQGEDLGQLTDLVSGILQWVDDVNKGHDSPDYQWTFETDGAIRVVTRDEPDKVYLVQASNPNARDFRLEEIGPAWSRTQLPDTGGGVYIGRVEAPTEGFTAYAVELVYDSVSEEGGQTYTTDVRIVPEIKPFAGTACRQNKETVLTGSARINDTGICALILANGNHQFSCGEDTGDFQFKIPLNENGEATLFAFADGFAPYSQTFVPDGLPMTLDMAYAEPDSPQSVLHIESTEPSSTPNWVDISGYIADNAGTRLCALVLANGEYLYTCDNPLGEFSLTVPLDDVGGVNVFGFADGFLPEQIMLSP